MQPLCSELVQVQKSAVAATSGSNVAEQQDTAVAVYFVPSTSSQIPQQAAVSVCQVQEQETCLPHRVAGQGCAEQG
jgi:hypothetical protein